MRALKLYYSVEEVNGKFVINKHTETTAFGKECCVVARAIPITIESGEAAKLIVKELNKALDWLKSSEVAVTLDEADSQKFREALENPPPPNGKLVNAVTKEVQNSTSLERVQSKLCLDGQVVEKVRLNLSLAEVKAEEMMTGKTSKIQAIMFHIREALALLDVDGKEKAHV